MPQNLVQKILAAHRVSGKLKVDETIGIKIDQTLTQDATGTMAYLEFEAMNISEIKTELSVSYVDHNTIQIGFENADDHRYLMSVAEKYGIYYSKAGNGICHQVHLERFGLPGKTLLGSDSHTPTGGGIGMLAIGAGGLDVACALAGLPFYMPYPKVLNVRLTGQLQPWVTAKDIILYLLELLSTKGNVGWMIEFSGPGVKTLSVPERATITNMGAELGVTCSLFPSDEITRAFLEAQERETGWRALQADPGANYDRTIEIDLSTLEPRLATPHSPGNISLVKNLAGKKVDQVCIGSCTNSSYKDLMTVAEMVRDKTLPEHVSFIVAPGSRQVFDMIVRDGGMSSLIGFGARIMESTCGFCIGNGQAPGTDAISIRTNNRNFKGRSGNPNAQVFLASPETAAACAIQGAITDPRDMGRPPKIEIPHKFTIDDSMILYTQNKNQDIQRGPNIGDPPKNEPLPSILSGEIALKVGDKITTDHIMPAGNRLKYRSNIPKYSDFVFEPIDTTFPDRCLENKSAGQANFIVAGWSYGQGSSREHAAICPAYLGVKAVIAKSIERIHRSNLINFGIIPIILTHEEDYDQLEQAEKLAIPDIKQYIKDKDLLTIKNLDKGLEIQVHLELTSRERDILLIGGLLNHIRKQAKQ